MQKQVTLDISEYLSEEEIKDAVTSELRAQVRDHYSKNKEHFLSNIGYHAVAKYIDELGIDENPIATLRENVVKLMNNPSSVSYLFFKKSEYGSKEGLGTKLINEVFNENKENLRERIAEELNGSDAFGRIKEDLESVMLTAFEEYIKDCFGVNKND